MMRAMLDGGLPRYLQNKAEAMSATAARLASGDAARESISAECSATDLTGVRRIRIRDFQFVSDSGPAFGGYSLGPSSPELLLGVLASCLTHMYLIAAAWRGIVLHSVSVRVEAENNDARLLGLETADPPTPFNLRAFVKVESEEPPQELGALHDYVEEACPLTRLIKEPATLEVHRL
jgi:uncharacterized OsmC-like protein